jgi:hypothetical protein
MRFRDTIICVTAVLLSAGLFIIAGSQLQSLNVKRRELGLVIDRPEDIPPSLAFATIATGAFRGLVVDCLWLRAERLKEEGQFFDAKQLADWITILQPRFTQVWDFQAWNMAYNISVSIPASEPQERWRWVKNGYELLRDKGIVVNPKSISLYRRLALIFQHKIGGVTDDDHKYYKLQLALEMEPLLKSEDNSLGAADNRYFEKLAKAPKEFKKVSEDPNFQPLIDELRKADEIFADSDKFVGNYLSLRQNPSGFKPQAFEVIDRFRGTNALKKFDIFAKAYQLRYVWKLEPELMVELNNNFGPTDWDDPNNHLPLEWRHPDVHAMYWAYKALMIGSKGEFSVPEANADRMINHSLQSLFRTGKIYIYSQIMRPQSDSISDANSQVPVIVQQIYLRPDLRMFKSYNKAAMARIEKYEQHREGTTESMRIGHRNMLQNAILSFYQAGLIEQAQEIYNQLKELYPLEKFNVALAVFVRQRFREELTELRNITNSTEIIQMIMREAYFRYAMRDDDQAAISENIAKEAYDLYQSDYANEEAEEKQRMSLPDYERLQYLALIDFLMDEQYPAVMRNNLFNRIEIEKPELFEKIIKERDRMLQEQQQSEQ